MRGKKRSVLITGGGTREAVDDVRSITNSSTGRLGALIASVFAESGAEVDCIWGEASHYPPSECELYKIRDTAQLMEVLDDLLREKTYDCVIHSMAVSDYKPRGAMTAEVLADAIRLELGGETLSSEEMTARIRSAILKSSERPTGKISSDTPELLLTLTKTPKVIRLIKEIQPDTLLIGFKLLSGASEAALLEAGYKLIRHSGCDYVLANDTGGISGDSHMAFLMDKSGILRRAGTKQDIARIIFECADEFYKGN